MLKIRVNNQEIYIKKGTSIQMEVNNSIFSIDEIPGEIIYTFDVPAQQNDKIFNFARFVYVQKIKKFEAEILVGGVQIAKGDLYIQKATKTTYSLGVVVNPFPTGWAEKMLNESDYGEIIISQNSTEHKAKWLAFLKNSLKENSNIKFPLFISENFYGGKNEDFGFYEGKQASIYPDTGNPTPELEKFFVNRLFTENGNVVAEINSSRGIKVFNKDTGVPMNTFTFSPAFQLLHFLRLYFNSININLIGNFFYNQKIKSIYFQSLRALDSSNEYNIRLGVFLKTKNKNEIIEYNYPDNNKFKHTIFEYENKKMHYFTVSKNSYVDIEIEINLVIPKDFFKVDNQSFENILLLYFLDDRFKDPNLIKYYDSDNPWLYDLASLDYIDCYFLQCYTKNRLQTDIGYNGMDLFYTFKYQHRFAFKAGEIYRFYIDKFQLSKGINLPEEYRVMSRKYIDFFSNEINVYNSFSNVLRMNEHVPNLTNGNFVKTILNTFGLSFYIDQQKKEIELSFIKDILNSSYIQLDKYLLNNESYISESEEKKTTYKFLPVTNNDVDNSRLTSEVENITDIGSAKSNFGKVAFIRKQNKYIESIRKGDANENWLYLYQKYSGNNKSITIGEGEKTEVVPSVLIPNMKDIDSNIGAIDVILEIDKTGVSPLISTGTTELDFILINCTGLQKLSKKIENRQLYYEGSQLVSETNNEYDLTVTGENSIGKTFIEPWLTLYSEHETVTHTFLLDLNTFLKVFQLLKPQNKQMEQQTRWVMVGSVKLLPKKMTFQFTEGKEYIFAEIEFAKPRVEI